MHADNSNDGNELQQQHIGILHPAQVSERRRTGGASQSKQELIGGGDLEFGMDLSLARLFPKRRGLDRQGMGVSSTSDSKERLRYPGSRKQGAKGRRDGFWIAINQPVLEFGTT